MAVPGESHRGLARLDTGADAVSDDSVDADER
jgi:hypothetical protein